MDSISNTTAPKRTHLEINDKKMGIDGLSRLIQDEDLRNIEKLRLAECQSGDEEAKIIGKNKVRTNLKVLGLGNNKIGVEGVSTICDNKIWTNLEEFLLEENQIGSVDAISIAENTT